MHEVGMCEGLVELIQRRAEGRPVTGARVRVGVRHAVVGDAFEQAFALASAGTPAEGAVVDLVVTPVTVACRSCGSRSESLDVLALCPPCGSDEVDVSDGDELVLESVDFGKEPRDVPGDSR
ncbi:hydrogenase maturation nickel metallochaperone HypA/HybF [Nonomuraea glycinis]|jgi:hydrogenase nickel incorporation protein HypA/HybF|uniref:hydrogenase maturation nickel metallochaperone HypA/HybF n=1 Tax=Nonomuraea glycinis TaxID=2047744 RepID=UPI002E1407C2|nr:hydrogenase maturation nickel metallochaperone HypA [Nonomuraea glycinis]